MAFDESRGHTILANGKSATEPFDDMWFLDDDTWTPAITPTPRVFPGFVFDEARSKVVMLGGDGVHDAYEWDDAWTAIVDPRTARRGQVVTYDNIRHVSLAFGGLAFPEQPGGILFENDLWSWNGSVWSPLTGSTKPPGRFYHQGAFDRARDRFVIFGGYVGTDAMHMQQVNDTWEWDGAEWHDRTDSTAPAPSPRTLAMMAYDAKRANIVLFGGDAAEGTARDTWTWDGAWHEVHPATIPPATSEAVMAYDPRREVVVMFGGNGMHDTWEWDGTNWRQRDVIGGEIPYNGNSMVYDTQRNHMMLYGANGELWILTSEAGPDERCDGLDLDGDDLLDCDDPDCANVCP